MCFAKNFQYPLVTKKKKRKVSNASILFHFKHWTVLDYCPWQRITFGAIFESLTFFPSNSGNDVILFMPLATHTKYKYFRDINWRLCRTFINFNDQVPFFPSFSANICCQYIYCLFKIHNLQLYLPRLTWIHKILFDNERITKALKHDNPSHLVATPIQRTEAILILHYFQCSM